MNKSSFLLLPTVLAVSTSARGQSSSVRTSRPQSTALNNHEMDGKSMRDVKIAKPRKSLSIDFVFSVSK